MKQLQPKQAITNGWYNFKQQPWLWAGITLALLIPNILGSALEPVLEEGYWLSSMVIGVAIWLLSFVLSLGLIKAALDAIDKNEKVEFSDLFSVYDNRLLRAFTAYLITTLIVGLAVVLAVVGGFLFAAGLFTSMEWLVAVGAIVVIVGFVATVYLSLRLYFAQYYVVDKTFTGIQAVKQSFADTKDELSALVGFGFLLAIINIVGFILLGVGLLVSIPVTFIALASAYRMISGDKELQVQSQVADAADTDLDSTDTLEDENSAQTTTFPNS